MKIEKRLPVSCPVCGRKRDYDVEELHEGATLACPRCGLELNLHGCMWEDVKKQLEQLKEDV
jgi:DNA-directed RNA polymerase subunit RPC12/RpoP